jgi:hypothetical protein
MLFSITTWICQTVATAAILSTHLSTWHASAGSAQVGSWPSSTASAATPAGLAAHRRASRSISSRAWCGAAAGAQEGTKRVMLPQHVQSKPMCVRRQRTLAPDAPPPVLLSVSTEDLPLGPIAARPGGPADPHRPPHNGACRPCQSIRLRMGP